jgi:hypothetical protein
MRILCHNNCWMDQKICPDFFFKFGSKNL